MPHTIIDATPGDLVVAALDFDGCIQRMDYEIHTKQEYLSAEKPLLTFLSQTRTNLILSGSSRQTPHLDDINAVRLGGLSAGISFNIFPWLTNDDRHFDPFLLNDLWATHEDGTAYGPGDTIKSVQACISQDKWDNELCFYHVWGAAEDMLDFEKNKGLLDKPDYHGELWMRDKLNLVYAHIHYLAHAYPNKKISYQLVDDIADYLRAVSYFYFTNPKLIPDNVNLQMVRHSYDGKSFEHLHTQSSIGNIYIFKWDYRNDENVKKENKTYEGAYFSEVTLAKCTIQGQGVKDPHYRETVKLFAQPAINPTKGDADCAEHYYASTIDVGKLMAARDEIAKKASTKDGTTFKASTNAPFFKPQKKTVMEEKQLKAQPEMLAHNENDSDDGLFNWDDLSC